MASWASHRYSYIQTMSDKNRPFLALLLMDDNPFHIDISHGFMANHNICIAVHAIHVFIGASMLTHASRNL